ncbi:EF-P beta-lysylation protein EpmB [Spartinivicinus poritis]|uniref:L-lysine 2,3-aminomutase n=1 Tax=Spartinivicinus poritis TaxID=2994640 RepID=A0ABT5U4L6_9GAMM|nr:EF-P beta-lysylation protein EpmB [Spartinivicinus sp. A2-2]MDE1461304.1 EF-P beta-lysylation protein EpmB [Spartinivicinus sp. A2-2]
MITRTAASVDTHFTSSRWQQILSSVVTDADELFHLLRLNPAEAPSHLEAVKQFPLRVPIPFINRIEPGNWNDPLLQQVLPIAQELAPQPGFTADPLGEQDKNVAKGIIHKYQGRLLLIVGTSCAVNCRYCFRRHFPYEDNRPNTQQWQSALEYITNDTSISEVIFSGGDPLAVNDKRLAWLVESIAAIPHVTRLRIHSRLPIMIPQRITDEMLSWFTQTRLKPVMVIHCNHPNEIDQDVCAALHKLRDHNVTLLNQAVLLKGINDQLETQIQLSETLFQQGVLPYYLFLLDRVFGAAHFEVSEREAKQLVGEMLKQCPGYLVPKLAREQAGAPTKLPILPAL